MMYQFAFALGYEQDSATVARIPSPGHAPLDQLVDPLTLDFVDTDDGEWEETADSRSIVLCQLELHLGKSYSTPGDGTEIKELLRLGDPVTPELLEADVGRALAVLEAAGTIGNVSIATRDENGDPLTDEAGRGVVDLTYTDLATGSPIEVVYRPLGG